MKLKQRLIALLTGAALLLTPAAAFAEGESYTIPSGEVTPTAVSDAYIGGEQINVTAAVELGPLRWTPTPRRPTRSSPRSPA